MKTVLLFLLLYPAVLWAQRVRITPEDMQRKQSFLLLRDGSVVRGQIVRQDSSLITVRKRGGEMTFVEADQLIGVLPIRPRPDSVAALPGVEKTYQLSPYSTFVFKDGSRVEGKYLRRDSTMITVQKRNGQLTYFEPELLDRVEPIRFDTVADSGLVFQNRFAPWLLTGQTAYTPEKGRFYYRNTWILLNEFQYGITRHWSVGVDFPTPIPYLSLAGFYTVGNYMTNNTRLSSKFSVPIGQNFRVGLNATYQPRPYYDSYQHGILTFQVLGSIGNSQRNLTFGYGLINQGRLQYTYFPSPSSSAPQYTYVSIPNQSFLTVGIMQKVLPTLTLVSDNRINLGQHYYYNNNGERATLSFAFRLDRRRHAFDLGIYSLIYRDNYLWDGKRVRFFPYVGYNLLIGR